MCGMCVPSKWVLWKKAKTLEHVIESAEDFWVLDIVLELVRLSSVSEQHEPMTAISPTEDIGAEKARDPLSGYTLY